MSESESQKGDGQRLEQINGWNVKVMIGNGCLGPSTCTVTGEKDGKVVTAVAGDEPSALAMLENMISRRNSSSLKP